MAHRASAADTFKRRLKTNLGYSNTRNLATSGLLYPWTYGAIQMLLLLLLLLLHKTH